METPKKMSDLDFDPEFKERTPIEVAQRMAEANEKVYWYLFVMGFGSDCHAFLEFCGLMSKYQQLCRKAAEAGIDFRHANVHSDEALPMEEHDVRYLAEKFECIFGSFFRDNPDLARLFAQKALSL
jgi:hypothetical protein